MRKTMLITGLFILAALVVSEVSPTSAAETATGTNLDYHAEFRAKVAPLREQLYAKRSELAAQYDGNAADDVRVQELIREVADLQARIYSARLELESKYRADGYYDEDGYAYHGYRGNHGRGSWSHGDGHGYVSRHGGGHW